MSHLESLTKKLHALLPELLELSFGCRVKFLFSEEICLGRSEGHLLFLSDKGGDGERCRTAKLVTDEMVTYAKGTEILGRPIGLEHVLKALDDAYGWVEAKGSWSVLDEDNKIISFIDILDEKKNSARWQLGLPLDQQSPELHKFLDSLLPESGYDQAQRLHDEHTATHEKAKDETAFEMAKSLIPDPTSK